MTETQDPEEGSTPTHWTYEAFDLKSDLQQGDIIESTNTIHQLCKNVHPYFCDPKFIGFMVITQSCDLVRRKKDRCNTNYINLAVIRSLEDILPLFLNSVCPSPISGVYLTQYREDAKKLLSRIFNQNEQSLGVFYLHPDAQAGIAVQSVCLLRVSVSFRSQHYSEIVEARRGRLTSEFKSKLGWLTGNLFSRVGTTDWSEPPERQKELEKLISIFMGDNLNYKSDNLPIWVDRNTIENAKKAGFTFENIEKKEIESIISKYEPDPPIKDIAIAVKDIIKKLSPNLGESILDKIEKRVLNDGKIAAALRRAKTNA